MNLNSIRLWPGLLLFFCLSCGSNSKTVEEVRQPQGDRYTGLRQSLLTKHVSFLDSIPGLSGQFLEGGLMYYYSGFDCGSCVLKGIASVKALKQLGQKVEVVAFQANVGQDQEYFDFKERIWVDKDDFLHDNFTFLPTPFFLSINADRQVEDVYFPLNTGVNPDSARFFTQFSTQ